MIKKYNQYTNESASLSKKDVYNSFIATYLKTGQGVPGFILSNKNYKEPVNQLIEEGKLKIVNQEYSYLPDDQWICLTGVYCVEEEVKKESRALDYLRKYLNIPGNKIMDTKLEDFFNENPKEREKYNQWYNDWLKKNEEILEKSFQIRPE